MTKNAELNAALRNAVNTKTIDPRTTRADFNAQIRAAAGYAVKKETSDETNE